MITVPFVWNEHEVPYDCARYTSFGIKALLERHGFEVTVQEKASIGIEALSQIALIYLNGLLEKISFHNTYIMKIARCLILPPVILMILIVAKIFPYGNDFYLSNIVLCRKIRSCLEPNEESGKIL